MEILKQGNPQDITYLHKCETCGCVMLFKESEKQKDNKGTFVTCPTCGDITTWQGWTKALLTGFGCGLAANGLYDRDEIWRLLELIFPIIKKKK